MLRSVGLVSTLLASLLLPATLAVAGPDWEEGEQGTGDAGALGSEAQVPKGQQPFTTNLATLSGALGADLLAGTDAQDMYVIYVDTPALFTATVTGPTGGSLAFDTQLWLFDFDGFGLLGNDGPGLPASLGASATDGSGSSVTTSGVYLLAITPVNSDPLDAASDPLFDQATTGEVSGPDGAGGGNPLADWSPATTGGDYVIVLTGAAFPPCRGDLAAPWGEIDTDDLLTVINDWGCTGVPGTCEGDISGPSDVPDGTTDTEDLLELINSWGTDCVADPTRLPPP